MKPPHEMTAQERQEWRVEWMETAEWLVEHYRILKKGGLSEQWKKEYERLKEIVKRNEPTA